MAATTGEGSLPAGLADSLFVGDANVVRSLSDEQVNILPVCPVRVDERTVFVGAPNALTELLKSPHVGRPRHAARRSRSATTSEPRGDAAPAWASLGIPRQHWAVQALIRLNRASTKRDSVEHQWTGSILRRALALGPYAVTASAVADAQNRLRGEGSLDAVSGIAVPAGAEVGFGALGLSGYPADRRVTLVQGARQLLASFSPSFEGLDPAVLLAGFDEARRSAKGLLAEPGAWPSGSHSAPERVAVFLLTTLAMFTNNVAAATAHAAMRLLTIDDHGLDLAASTEPAELGATLLREHPPVPYMFPVVLESSAVAGVTLRPADVVFGCVATANRMVETDNGSAVVDPYGFTFGVGQMRCPGREVAVQAQLGAIDALLKWRRTERFSVRSVRTPADIVAVPSEILLSRQAAG